MSRAQASLLDDFLPRADASRTDEIWLLGAKRQAAFDALKAVTVGEVPLFRMLMALRAIPGRLVGEREEALIDPRLPLLEGFLRYGFIVLDERPDLEYLIGGVGRFWSPSHNLPVEAVRSPQDFVAFAEPGYVKAAFDFVAIEEPGGIRLSSEIRMLGTSPAASSWFRVYWLSIGWLSGLIRRSGLRAVRHRLA